MFFQKQYLIEITIPAGHCPVQLMRLAKQTKNCRIHVNMNMYKCQEHTRIETVKLAEVGTSPSSCGGMSSFCCGGRHQLKNSSYLLDHVHVKKWVPCAINFAPSDVNGHSAPQVHHRGANTPPSAISHRAAIPRLFRALRPLTSRTKRT